MENSYRWSEEVILCNFDTDSSFINDVEECAWVCCIISSIYCATNWLWSHTMLFLISVYQTVWFHDCSLRHKTFLVQNNCLIQDLLRVENDNWPHTSNKGSGGRGNSVMTKKRTYGLGRNLLGRRANSSRLWHGTHHVAFMCRATTLHQCTTR